MLSKIVDLLVGHPRYQALPLEQKGPTAQCIDRALIVVAAYKNVEVLERLIISLTLDEAYPHDILVVNSGESPSISDFARERGISIMERPNIHQNHGAYNDAILRNSAYRYYLLLDHDVYAVSPLWLTTLTSLFEGRPNMGAVGNLFVEFEKFYHLGHLELEQQVRHVLWRNRLLPAYDYRLDHLSDHVILLSNNVLTRAGLYQLFTPDDKMASIVSEVELSVRLRQLGYEVASVPKPVFQHRDWDLGLPPSLEELASR